MTLYEIRVATHECQVHCQSNSKVQNSHRLRCKTQLFRKFIARQQSIPYRHMYEWITENTHNESLY